MKSILILLALLVSLQAEAQNWVRTNGPVEDNVFDLCIDSNGILYAVTAMGVNRSTDGGEHWTRPFTFPEVSQLSRITVAPDGSILASSGAGIFRSVDSANTFSLCDVEMISPITNIVFQFATSGSGRMYATHILGLFRSNDNGRSWTSISGTTFNGESPMFVAASHDTVIMHTQAHGFASFDNGKTWQMFDGVEDPQIYKLLILPDGSWGCLDYFQGLLKYFPGLGWKRSDEGPSDPLTYNADCMHDGSLLVSSMSGIYHVDGTSKWTDITSGFGRDDSNNLHIVARFVEDRKNGVLYAGSFGAGVWEHSSAPSNINNDAPQSHFQVYPNPFTGRTSIYVGGSHSWSEIELRDLLGAVVWKRERSVTATNTVSIDVSGIPAGNYLLALRTDRETRSQWITILK